MSVAVFTREASWSGTERIFPWIEIQTVDSGGSAVTVVLDGASLHTVKPSSGVAADGRITRHGVATRELSSLLCELAIPTWQISGSDHDQLALRARLGNEFQAALRGCEITGKCWPVSDVLRSSPDDPLVTFRGIITDYQAIGDYSFTITASGILGPLLDQPLPMRAFASSEFGNLPASSVGRFAPFVLGAPADSARGVVRGTPIGLVADLSSTTWLGIVLAWGRCQSIDNVYVYDTTTGISHPITSGIGSIWTWFGTSGYGTFFASHYYQSVTGDYYTIVYTKDPTWQTALTDGSAILQADMHGYTSLEDGSGTLLDTHLLAFQWLMMTQILNVPPHTQGGSWLGAATYHGGTTKLSVSGFNQLSLATAQNDLDAVVPAGNAVAFAIYDPSTIRQLLTDFLSSASWAMGHNLAGQVGVALLPPEPAGAATVDDVSAIHDIFNEGFTPVQADIYRWFNVIAYRYGYDAATDTWSEDSVEDQQSIDAYKQRLVSQPLTLLTRRDPIAAQQIASRFLAALRKGAQSTRFQRGLPALADELGSRIRVTHPDPNWTLHRFQQSAVSFDGDALAVAIDAWDLEWMLGVQVVQIVPFATAGVTQTLTVAAAQKKSAWIIVYGAVGANISSISGGGVATWNGAAQIGPFVTSYAAGIYYGGNANGTGTTITITWGGGITQYWGAALEVTGLALDSVASPLIRIAGGSHASDGLPQLIALAGVKAGDFIASVLLQDSAITGGQTAAPYFRITSAFDPPVVVAFRRASKSGTLPVQPLGVMTGGATNWLNVTAAFRTRFVA